MIESATTVDGAVEVAIRGEPTPVRLGWSWLRDHCHCADCYDTSTGQRLVSLRDVITNGGPSSAAVEPGGQALEVVWAGSAHRSRFTTDLIRSARSPDTASWLSRREPWDASRFVDFSPEVGFEDFVATPEGLRQGLRHLATHGFCLVTGTPPTMEATRRTAERIGYVRQSVFGGMWGFQADGARADSAYTATELAPHTDSTYSHDAPGLQVLHCIHLDADGGESVLVDGLRVAEEIEATNQGWARTLATVPIPGQYIEDGVHLMASRPALRHDGRGRLEQVSFNNNDRAPMWLPENEMIGLYEALAALERTASEPSLQHTFRLEPGKLLIFDNWRVLHARKAFRGDRRVVGCYLNREDFESRLRLI